MAAETLLTIIAAHDGIGIYDLIAATGHRHRRAFSREYSDALDALVAAGTVSAVASFHLVLRYALA